MVGGRLGGRTLLAAGGKDGKVSLWHVFTEVEAGNQSDQSGALKVSHTVVTQNLHTEVIHRK